MNILSNLLLNPHKKAIKINPNKNPPVYPTRTFNPPLNPAKYR